MQPLQYDRVTSYSVFSVHCHVDICIYVHKSSRTDAHICVYMDVHACMYLCMYVRTHA